MLILCHEALFADDGKMCLSVWSSLCLDPALSPPLPSFCVSRSLPVCHMRSFVSIQTASLGFRRDEELKEEACPYGIVKRRVDGESRTGNTDGEDRLLDGGNTREGDSGTDYILFQHLNLSLG